MDQTGNQRSRGLGRGLLLGHQLGQGAVDVSFTASKGPTDGTNMGQIRCDPPTPLPYIDSD